MKLLMFVSSRNLNNAVKLSWATRTKVNSPLFPTCATPKSFSSWISWSWLDNELKTIELWLETDFPEHLSKLPRKVHVDCGKQAGITTLCFISRSLQGAFWAGSIIQCSLIYWDHFTSDWLHRHYLHRWCLSLKPFDGILFTNVWLQNSPLIKHFWLERSMNLLLFCYFFESTDWQTNSCTSLNFLRLLCFAKLGTPLEGLKTDQSPHRDLR